MSDNLGNVLKRSAVITLQLCITFFAIFAMARHAKAGDDKSTQQERVIDINVSDTRDIPVEQILQMNESEFLNHEYQRLSRYHAPLVEDWPFYHLNQGPHQVRVINEGLVDLGLRLRMIARAKSSIEYMTFIFTPDTSGRMILHALLDRALHGVNVRLLLDWPMFKKEKVTDNDIAAIQLVVAEQAKINPNVGRFEVRYYNRGELALNPQKMNHRNHAKMFVIDGREMLLGGQNTADDYFSLGRKGLNYIDRDMWVASDNADEKSNVCKQASAAFNAYWNDKVWAMKAKHADSLDPEEVQKHVDMLTQADSDSRLSESANIREILEKTSHDLGGPDDASPTAGSLPVYQVSKMTLVIDRPAHSREDRRVTPVVEWRLANAKQYLIMENFLFAVSDARKNVFGYLSKIRKLPITILTNGFATGDSHGPIVFSMQTIRDLLRDYRSIWAVDVSGHAPPNMMTVNAQPPAKLFATHSKSLVIFNGNSASVMIGSYNFDERSEFLNNESTLIADDNLELAHEVTRQIRERMNDAHQLMIGGDGQAAYVDHTPMGKTGESALQTLARMLGLYDLLREQF